MGAIDKQKNRHNIIIVSCGTEFVITTRRYYGGYIFILLLLLNAGDFNTRRIVVENTCVSRIRIFKNIFLFFYYDVFVYRRRVIKRFVRKTYALCKRNSHRNVVNFNVIFFFMFHIIIYSLAFGRRLRIFVFSSTHARTATNYSNANSFIYSDSRLSNCKRTKKKNLSANNM